jgi:hypothetical protein
MHRRFLLALAASSSVALLAAGVSDARADDYRVSGPFTHENLSIYLVHGKSAPGRVPLTLEEALAKRVVRVYETGNVNELSVENLGGEDVFIQSGDIVKGGQQDRALTASLILPPKSGRIPLAAFCVEQGRWSARGREDVKTFTTASAAVPSREAKIAMKAPPEAAVPDRVSAGESPARSVAGRFNVANAESDTGTRQQRVWKRVQAIQERLSATVGTRVNSSASQTSLQLALENEKLQDLQTAYVKALEAVAKDDDVVGYVFAINGKLNSADIYPSNGLFRKMWPKLLKASAIEAIGHRSAERADNPTAEGAKAFLDEAMTGKSSEKALPASIQLETRTGDKSLYFETRRNGTWVHRNYLAM